jgi:hypothetical protein
MEMVSQLFAVGMIVGALVSILNFWVIYTWIINPKIKRSFEVELETNSEYITGILTVKELLKPHQKNKVKLGSRDKKRNSITTYSKRRNV